MPFTTNLTGTAQVDDSIIEEMDAQFMVAAYEVGIMDQFVTYRQSIGAKSIEMPKFAQLALATTPLVETEDVTSAALADSQIIFTPKEYGNVVTTTKLANLQTGGKADLAAARLVGINMGRTLNKLCVLAGEASGNVTTVTGGAQGTLVAGDVMTPVYLNKQYNKLARIGIAPLADGMYVAAMHDDVIHDLRSATGAGSWVDVNKYSNPETVLRNEVGMIGGFRIVRENAATIVPDGGDEDVDLYKSLFLGFNALGKAVSQEAGLRLTGPFDKLARFVNIGWHGVLEYGILDVDAIQVGITASSVGDNA
jgi:N4-gp56 family major capsid protein